MDIYGLGESQRTIKFLLMELSQQPNSEEFEFGKWLQLNLQKYSQKFGLLLI